MEMVDKLFVCLSLLLCPRDANIFKPERQDFHRSLYVNVICHGEMRDFSISQRISVLDPVDAILFGKEKAVMQQLSFLTIVKI